MGSRPSRAIVVVFFVLLFVVFGLSLYLFYTPLKESFTTRSSDTPSASKTQENALVTPQVTDYSDVPYRVYNNGWVEYVRLMDHEALKEATLSNRYEGVIEHIHYTPTEVEDTIGGGSFSADRSFTLGSEIEGDETQFYIASIDGELYVNVYSNEVENSNEISFDDLEVGDRVAVYEEMDLTVPLFRSRTRFDIVRIE